MSRYDNRVKKTMEVLRDAGYVPIMQSARQPDIEDDEIQMTKDIAVQVNPLSGDFHAVTFWSESEKAAYSWQVESYSDLISSVEKAFKKQKSIEG